MKPSKIKKGTTVYHAVFGHWGRGKVVAVRDNDALGLPNKRKFSVQWERSKLNTGPVWMAPDELRETPLPAGKDKK